MPEGSCSWAHTGWEPMLERGEGWKAVILKLQHDQNHLEGL